MDSENSLAQLKLLTDQIHSLNEEELLLAYLDMAKQLDMASLSYPYLFHLKFVSGLVIPSGSYSLIIKDSWYRQREIFD